MSACAVLGEEPDKAGLGLSESFFGAGSPVFETLFYTAALAISPPRYSAFAPSSSPDFSSRLLPCPIAFVKIVFMAQSG